MTSYYFIYFCIPQSVSYHNNIISIYLVFLHVVLIVLFVSRSGSAGKTASSSLLGSVCVAHFVIGTIIQIRAFFGLFGKLRLGSHEAAEHGLLLDQYIQVDSLFF